MTLTDQISKIDHQLSAILSSSRSSFERYLYAELCDVEREWHMSAPRGFKTAFLRTCNSVAEKKNLVMMRDAAAKQIEAILRTLDAIEHDVNAILRIESPKFADEVAKEIGLDDDAIKCLTDEEFMALLDKGRKIGSETKRLVYYLSIVKSVSTAIYKAHDRVAKLTERIKSDSGAESKAAIVLKNKIAAVEEILWRRREVVARLFLKQRRQLLTRLVSATAVFDQCWKTPSASLASLVKERDVEVELPLRLLSEMDEAHRYVPSASMKAARRAMK